MYVILFVNQSYRYFSQYTCITNLYTAVNPLSTHVCVCVCVCARVRVRACVRACVCISALVSTHCYFEFINSIIIYDPHQNHF